MQLITITSDWRKNDFYLPQLKGWLYSLHSAFSIAANGTANGEKNLFQTRFEAFLVTDISNCIKPFDVSQACFILRHSYRSYPQGTIHIVAVNSSYVAGCRVVVVKADGHYFIGPDDGRFSLLFDDVENVEAFAIDPGSSNFSYSLTRQIFENSSSVLKEFVMFCCGVEAIIGGNLMKLASCALKRITEERAVLMKDRIIGRVVYIDSYGNAITNISKETFLKLFMSAVESCGEEPEFTVFVQGPYLKIADINEHYTDVAQGNEVAFFNSAGLLELAINGGDFASVEGIDTTAEVVIKFG